jgi:hypothetical protein
LGRQISRPPLRRLAGRALGEKTKSVESTYPVTGIVDPDLYGSINLTSGHIPNTDPDSGVKGTQVLKKVNYNLW